MLMDRRKLVKAQTEQAKRSKQSIQHYSAFLSDYFHLGHWFVTITFRDRHKNLELDPKRPGRPRSSRVRRRFKDVRPSRKGLGICRPDPRINAWEPSSRFRKEPGPPVRDAALREIEHFLFELGWEAAGRSRQEIFDWLASEKPFYDRKELARRLAGKCLCCELLATGKVAARFEEVKSVATESIGWVIAEEFGRIGGRWHAHLLIRGVTHLRRRKWWRRALVRFGRTRIEPIHE